METTRAGRTHFEGTRCALAYTLKVLDSVAARFCTRTGLESSTLQAHCHEGGGGTLDDKNTRKRMLPHTLTKMAGLSHRH